MTKYHIFVDTGEHRLFFDGRSFRKFIATQPGIFQVENKARALEILSGLRRICKNNLWPEPQIQKLDSNSMVSIHH